jgi:hypothetical protein
MAISSAFISSKSARAAIDKFSHRKRAAERSRSRQYKQQFRVLIICGVVV